MGLDCSHDAWHGAYSAFMRWRTKIAEVAGLPPLALMEGFYSSLNDGSMSPTLYHGVNTNDPAYGDSSQSYMGSLDDLLPIRWDCLKPAALYELLNHSDCDGSIAADKCGLIADELEKIIPLLPDDNAGGHIGSWRDKTIQFVAGLHAAFESGESLDFH